MLHIFCLQGIPRDIVSDRGPQFPHLAGVEELLRTAGSLLQPYVDITPSRTDRMNQSLEKHPQVHDGLRLVSAATGVLPFMGALSNQPSLFKYQEEGAAVPLVQAYVRHCQRIWRPVRAALVCSSWQAQL